MLELATLGLLQKEPLHGYLLKKQMELFMSGCISVNYGAIYPLLRRLLEKELIVEQEDGNNNRKIYSITPAGKTKWLEKMLEHPHESWVNARSRFMIKFFFFSYLEPHDRLHLLEHRLKVCQLKLDDQDLQIVYDDCFQAIALERYKSDISREIDWLMEQLAMVNDKL
ncbi:PadR family transcriptional regulator [Cyanobacterium stanieri LEGE 03274]|uniref:PadR family transcriptional regulator n=1 Tax=Cyanobacterium stanieri LEGE 03274 TaxID=1828756 RepID=A0ABR9V5T2_9CHRO|nr:PadR family transcriptional regulator [Cyanobacterium stanieri]MBE9222856.1 PadR family transcriptional regulator [Cyanobacterium stanieri LEGE 03274]